MRSLFRACAVGAACLLLAACAGPAGKSTIAQQNAQTRTLSDAYARSLEADARLAPLWEKTSMIPNEATPDQLARADRASEADKPLLRELSLRALRYRAEMVALLKAHGVDAQLVTLWEGGAEAADVLRAQLHNGMLTWGEYNTRLRAITTAQRLAIMETNDAVTERTPQARADAERARQAAQEAYVTALAQPAQLAAGQAASRTCQAIGKAMYCQ